MANLNIKAVNYNIKKIYPSYTVTAIVDCEYGHEGIKYVSSPEELDKYYQGIKNREGLISLLESGASLYLTRLNREGTRSSTLRLLDNEFKYCHPKIYDILGTSAQQSVSLNEDQSIDLVSLHKSHTYSYVIDFNVTNMEDEDYIAIPQLYLEDLDYDNSVLFYFTNLNPVEGEERKYPNDFTPSVPLSTLGSKSLGIDINNVNKDDRARIIYDWYLGALVPDSNKYEFLGAAGDDNLIPDLCELDEEANKVTLVFKKPIRNIQYYNSNSSNKFSVESNIFLNQELIAKSSIGESIVSFKSSIEGNINIQLSLKYVRNYEFELELYTEETSEYHYVTLDKDAPLYEGRSIYLQDVIDTESDIIKAEVHLGGRIYSELDSYSMEEAKKLEGTYNISYGVKGDNVPVFNQGVLEYPFERSLNNLLDSDKISNLFLFEEGISKELQTICVEEYLRPNHIVGFYNLAETLSESEVAELIVEDSNREFLIYTYGRSIINDNIIDNSYLYAQNCINGDFKNKIIEGSIPRSYDNSINTFLDSNSINYLDKTNTYYFINKIVNLEAFLEPSYVLVFNYVKVYLNRFLSSKLGMYSENLKKLINVELSKISSYSSLLDSLTINDFTSTNNNLYLVLDLKLRGLIGKSLDVIININK